MNPFTRSLFPTRTQIAMQAARQPNPAQQCPTGYFYDIGTGECAPYPACEWQHMQAGSTYEEALQLCANCMSMFMEKFGVSYAEARQLCSAGKPAPTGLPTPKQGHMQRPAPKQGHLRPQEPGSSSQAAPGMLAQPVPSGPQPSRPGTGNFTAALGPVQPAVDPCMANCTGGKMSLMGYCWRKCRGTIKAAPTAAAATVTRVANRAYRYL